MIQHHMHKKKRGDEEAADPTRDRQEAPVADDLQACIAQRAFELYEQGGCCHGHDYDHWLQAEQDVLSSERWM